MAKGFSLLDGHALRQVATTLQDKAKRLEDLGFDALRLPDHLGAPAPFPALTAIASRDVDRAAGHLRAQRRLLQAGAAGS